MAVFDNSLLNFAKGAKNDEFYTQYEDVEKECDAYFDNNESVFRNKVVLLPCDDYERSNFTKYFAENFYKFGLKKLISSCYNPNFSPLFSPNEKGKLFIKDSCGESVRLLNGDGDFRSDEVSRLRDEADFVITNPPFSLFREFLDWCETDKRFVLIMGNMNGVKYKNVYPLIKENKLWLGHSIWCGDRRFEIPEHYTIGFKKNLEEDEFGKKYVRVVSVRWFTNIDNGKKRKKLKLMTMSENLSKNKRFRGKEYKKYDNYDALDVPVTSAIPSDYNGVMGVPITFLDKYNPEQFEIVSSAGLRTGGKSTSEIQELYISDGFIDGKQVYARIAIKHKEK